MTLKNCWEIKNCGRQVGGSKAAELGVCPASSGNLGHHCWWVTGTFCGGKVQGTFAQKEQNCMACDVYKLYNPLTGTEKNALQLQYPDEVKKVAALRKR